MDKLSGFKLYLIKKGISPNTVEKNVYRIKSLLSTLPALTIDCLDQFFIRHLEKGGSKSYLNLYIVALKHWGEYIGNPVFKSLRYFRVDETHKATMSDREIESFLSLPFIKQRASNQANYNTWTLFFKILAYSGMRPGEVANLTTESIDFGSNLFILEKTKTTPRSVPIAPTLISDLTEHIKNLSGDTLFARKGKPFNKQMWQHYFEMRIKRLGIKRKNLTCYSLRHSFITRWAGEDINIFKIQRIVGHKRIETTSHYMHLVTKDLTQAMNKDPLARANLPYFDRLKLLREVIRKGLDDYAASPEEEKQMVNDLKVF